MKELLVGFWKNYLAKYYCKIMSLHSLKKKRTVCSTRKLMLSTEHVSKSLLTVILVPTKPQTLPQTCWKNSCSQFHLLPEGRNLYFNISVWCFADGREPLQACWYLAAEEMEWSCHQNGAVLSEGNIILLSSWVFCVLLTELMGIEHHPLFDGKINGPTSLGHCYVGVSIHEEDIYKLYL